jgi:hypothetical protein
MSPPKLSIITISPQKLQKIVNVLSNDEITLGKIKTKILKLLKKTLKLTTTTKKPSSGQFILFY